MARVLAQGKDRTGAPTLGLGSALAAAAFAVAVATPAMADPVYRLEDGRQVEPLDIFQDCDVCPEMVVLPLGIFTMGAPLEESRALARAWPEPKEGEPPKFWYEGPPHEVRIDVPVAIGRNEVTNEEWMACVADGGCRHDPDRSILRVRRGEAEIDHPRHPIIRVSLLDVLEYTAWLNEKVGAKVYRPPTEAEWEYAARAGTTTRFAQGNTLTKEQANFTDFKWVNGRSFPDRNAYAMPLPVDELDAANAWGLRHMSGNVTEWTMSCFTEPHLGLETSSAYLAEAMTAYGCWVVTKGGHFAGDEEYARPAFRGRSKEGRRDINLGFRVLRELRGN